MVERFPISPETLVQRLEDSQEFMDKVTSGFSEKNERILYRKPSVNSDGQMEYADLVDNTLASYLEKMPKNVIQKLPTFTLDAHTRNKAEDLAFEYIGSKIIMRNGTSKGYTLLQKHWIAMRNAGAFGACAAYLPFLNDHGEYTVGFEPIYWGDLYPEAYASNINSANFVQFRDLRTEEDLNRILAGLDTEEGGTWSKKGVQTVLDYGAGQPSGREQTNTKAAMEGLPEHMYELFVYVDDDWVVYWHYASATILRVIRNHSGRRRVTGLYSDYDGSSIMGRSLVDMAYSSQQALTSLLRNFIYTSDYNTDPAKFVKGVNLDADKFNLKKGNTMFLNDEDGEVKLLPIDTTTLQNFPNLFSLLKGAVLTSLPSSNDSSISASIGDPTYSKTQAGVNSQDAKADIDNNYYRKNYEQFFEMTLENQINIYLAEVKAIADKNDAVALLEVDDEYGNLIREVDPSFINDNNQVQIDLSDFKGVNVSVDFESTQELAKEKDLQRLNTFMTGFFEAAKSDQSMAKVMRSVIPLLMEEMAKSSNLDSSAKISATMKEALEQVQEEEAQAQAAQQAAQAEEKSAMAEVKPPTVNISFKDLPPAGKIQAAAKYGIELTAEDLVALVAQEGTQDVGI